MAYAAVIVVAAVPIGLSWQRLAHAQGSLRAAQDSLERLSQDAKELLELGSRQEQISLQQRPAQDVIALVNAVLAEIGLPARHLRSLTPESDGALDAGSAGASGHADEAKIRRQSLRLTLENLNVRDLGAFLARWRSSQSVWTATRIELTHVRSAASTASLDENRYDASILISALYLEGS